MAKSRKFFDESTEQSKIKAEIVAKYFWAWANAIKKTVEQLNTNIAYIDLFAGPGRYNNGAKSTPILVLERAVDDPFMQQRLKTLFNDRSPKFSSELITAINEIPGIKNLHHEPIVYTSDVGTEIVKMFKQMKLIPTLFFVDPWGYKGLSLQLISSVLKDWGCDCIFFFNYNRINMGLNNDIVKEHMNQLFGEERANELRARLEGLEPEEREFEILEAITHSLQELGGKYVLPFTFKREIGKRTSHYLIFVSKHVLGYTIMKSIMAGYSSQSPQGVPSFAYSPATERQPLLFELSRPLEDLSEMLLSDFAGQTLTMKQVFDKHQVGKPFIKSNYKDALNDLESQGKILADPPAGNRRKQKGKITFADHVKVSF
ncbi:MAG TPA: three-Cys-motif partner protein TcmP, partial [Thermoplasmata archaeon]|nr:three-Cys-motif partner protein TcmP [Thermoplasmata archaeon]